MNRKFSKSLGFTLVEMILALGIIAIAAIATYSYISKRLDKAEASLNAQLINQLSGNIIKTVKGYDLKTNLSASQSEIDKIITPVNLIRTKSVPPEMVQSNSTIKNIYGSPVTLSTAIDKITGTNLDVITLNVAFNAGSASSCSAILSEPELLKSADGIKIGGTYIKSFGLSNIEADKIGNLCRAVQSITLSYVLFESAKTLTEGEQCTDCGNARNPESPYHIITGLSGSNYGTNSAIGGPFACGGGSSWNAASGACICNNKDEQWNGINCVKVWTTSAPNNSGFCPLGYGWNRAKDTKNKCEPLVKHTSGTGPDVNSEARLKSYLTTQSKPGSYYRPLDNVLYPKDLDGTVRTANIYTTSANCPTCANPKDIASISLAAPAVTNVDPNSLPTAYTTEAGRYIPSNIPMNTSVSYKANQNIQSQCNALSSGSPLNVPRSNLSNQYGYDTGNCQQCIISGGIWDSNFNRCSLPTDTLAPGDTTPYYTNAIKDVKSLDSCVRAGLFYQYDPGTKTFVCK